MGFRQLQRNVEQNDLEIYTDKLRQKKNEEMLGHQMSYPMRLWYLSHRRPAKAQASLRICTDSPKPLLFAHMKYGSRGRVRPKIRHLAPLDFACAFEEWVYGEQKVPQSHELTQIKTSGWLGWAKVLGSFQCRGVLLLLHIVGQGPAVLAAGAGWVGYMFYIFIYLPFLM